MFIIKSFHQPTDGGPNKVHFWQTPWVVAEDSTRTYREVGGWQRFSGHATVYPTEAEAQRVNEIRYLGGRVDTMRLTPQS